MKILLVEDDDATRKGIAMFLRAEGHEVTAASGGSEAFAALRREPHDLVVSDIRMPGMDGLTLLERLREGGNAMPVLMMTAYATVQEAVRALQAGADDYLTKPLNLDELTVRVQHLAAKLSLIRENRQLRDRLRRVEFPEMVGGGKAIQDLRKSVGRLAADPDVPVMIYGESGTGKELVARTIHCQSLRSKGTFVDVSCAAFSEELLESELFGYKKGAFTGALRDKEGLVQAAHGGTLFLDEVSEMSPRMQSRLLRFLQEHTILPVGATTSTAVDVRVVGASNRELHDMVSEGKFREDLYYRMNVVEVRLPLLRERREDIPLLVEHFIAKHAGQRRRLRLSREALDRLDRHSWPGNIRELENLVRVLLVSCEGEEAGLEDLPARLRSSGELSGRKARSDWSAADFQTALHAAVAEFEGEYLRQHLDRNHGNVSKTAAAIGLSRVALHKKIKDHGLAL
jgi:DNA-binding NtrC family response regulator